MEIEAGYDGDAATVVGLGDIPVLEEDEEVLSATVPVLGLVLVVG